MSTCANDGIVESVFTYVLSERESARSRMLTAQTGVPLAQAPIVSLNWRTGWKRLGGNNSRLCTAWETQRAPKRG
jgi:hypothetical protein